MTIREWIEREAESGRNLGRRPALLDESFESAPEGIVMFDMESPVLRINREFLRMFGYTREDVIGHHIRELTVPEDLRGEWETLRAKAIRGKQINIETIRQRKEWSDHEHRRNRHSA